MTIQVSISSASKDFKCDLKSLKKWIEIISESEEHGHDRKKRSVDEKSVYSLVRDFLSPIVENVDDNVVFIHGDTSNHWVNSLGIDISDLRQMNTSRFIPDMRRFPLSSSSEYRASGIMFCGEKVRAATVKSVIIVGGKSHMVLDTLKGNAIKPVIRALMRRESDNAASSLPDTEI